ncbi:MAG: Ig-like domain-containing protein [Clostridiales bacterium]|nr:Ig-like domain-containing protein [Clostridiales bacterium]
MRVNVTAITLNTGQSSSRLKVTGFQTGDSVRALTSGNSRIVKVTGKPNGTCVLTAGKVTGKTTIAITMKICLKRGKSYLLKPVLTPSNSTEKKTYTSRNKKVATVNATGKIIAKGKGTTTITVRSGKISARCKVTVK